MDLSLTIKKLTTLDELLTCVYHIKEEDKFVDPFLWYTHKLKLGVSRQVLLRGLSDAFNLNIVDSVSGLCGYWFNNEFYSEANEVYSYELSSKHFNTLNYGIILDGVVGDVYKKSLALDVFTELYIEQHYKTTSKYSPSSISILSGFMYSHFKTNTSLIKKIEPQISMLFPLNRFKYEQTKITGDVKKNYIDVVGECLKEMSKTSKSLFVFSGDDIDCIKTLICKKLIVDTSYCLLNIDNYSKDSKDTIYLVSIEDINNDISIKIKSILSNQRNKIILFSNQLHIFNLYDELRGIVGLTTLYKQLSNYYINVKIPKLCGSCKINYNQTKPVDDLSYGIVIPIGNYFRRGNGCENCLNGYSGWSFTKSSMSNKESFFTAIEKFELQRCASTPPYNLSEFLIETKSPTIFMSLSRLIKHGDISVEDGFKFLL